MHTPRCQQARRRRHNPAFLIAAAGLASRCDTEGKGWQLECTHSAASYAVAPMHATAAVHVHYIRQPRRIACGGSIARGNTVKRQCHPAKAEPARGVPPRRLPRTPRRLHDSGPARRGVAPAAAWTVADALSVAGVAAGAAWAPRIDAAAMSLQPARVRHHPADVLAFTEVAAAWLAKAHAVLAERHRRRGARRAGGAGQSSVLPSPALPSVAAFRGVAAPPVVAPTPPERGANAPRPGQRGANAPRPGQRGANAPRPAQRGANAPTRGDRRMLVIHAAPHTKWFAAI
eukprot:jgi/Tetstr1/457884/TSEL_044403.t1